MRSKVVKTLALALMLGGVSIVMGEQNPQRVKEEQLPPKRKIIRPEGDASRAAKQKAPAERSKLEKMLAEALKNNPDIRVAAANLALAEAELNRTRLQVTQKILTLHHAIHSQQALVNYEQKQYERFQGLLKDRAIDEKLLEERFAKLTVAKAKLAELEAQMPALLGKTSQTEFDLTIKDAKLLRQGIVLSSNRTTQATIEGVEPHKVTGRRAERLRKALQTPIKVDFKDMTFDAILKHLEKVPGLSFRNVFLEADSAQKMNLQFEEALPVSAILQALADESGCHFFVREYGIVATTGNNQPPGAMTVEEFLRHKPAEK